jgi:hypothetical protein
VTEQTNVPIIVPDGPVISTDPITEIETEVVPDNVITETESRFEIVEHKEESRPEELMVKCEFL